MIKKAYCVVAGTALTTAAVLYAARAATRARDAGRAGRSVGAPRPTDRFDVFVLDVPGSGHCASHGYVPGLVAVRDER